MKNSYFFFLLSLVAFFLGACASHKVEPSTPAEVAHWREPIRKGLIPANECYQEALKKNPKLSGVVTLHFEVSDQGKIEKIEVSKSTLKNGEVENCLKGIISKIDFGNWKHGQTAVIDYPFTFENSLDIKHYSHY